VNASTVLPSGKIANALKNLMELEKMDTVSELMNHSAFLEETNGSIFRRQFRLFFRKEK
jgi:PleD family two-component response regulator